MHVVHTTAPGINLHCEPLTLLSHGVTHTVPRSAVGAEFSTILCGGLKNRYGSLKMDHKSKRTSSTLLVDGNVIFSIYMVFLPC